MHDCYSKGAVTLRWILRFLRGDFYWSKYLIVNIVNKPNFIIPERWKFSEQEQEQLISPAEDYTFTI